MYLYQVLGLLMYNIHSNAEDMLRQYALENDNLLTYYIKVLNPSTRSSAARVRVKNILHSLLTYLWSPWLTNT